jgi:hypothetical protein
MADYWSAADVLKQLVGELGLPKMPSIASVDDVQAVQLLSLLNSAGNELLTYYPWAQFAKEWAWQTVKGQSDYDLPQDWSYFIDQTQWDRTDHWPLYGPKSAQEWAWLKGSLVAALPRQRFRVANNKFMLWPIPGSPNVTMAMEYIVRNWVIGATSPASMVTQDGDVIQYNPWLIIKFVKMKFYELKGFPTTGVQGDFMRIFNSLTGKDTGAKILSLAPRHQSPYLGPWSVPDGSWNVTGA